MELASLIQKVAAGDRASLLALYDTTSSAVFGLVLRIAGDRSSAEDVMLEVYKQAWSRASEYRPESISALVWLLSITRDCSLDRRRQSRREPAKLETAGPEASAACPDEHVEEPELLSQVRARTKAAIEALPSEQRMAIELAFYRGMSPGEVAAQLGQPRAAIATRLRLGMAKIAEMLKNNQVGPGDRT